jgi:hypothetical protein
MADTWEKPSTKHLSLKPKEITPIDPRAVQGDGTAISVKLIHAQNRVAEEKAKARAATSTPFPASDQPAEPALHPAFKPKDIEKVNGTPQDEEV